MRHSARGGSPFIWYISYGSNINESRFLCYIQGGQPEGTKRCYAGCTDKTAPFAGRTITIRQGMYFAGESRVWGGGSAFITHRRGRRPTKAYAYLITKRQLEEVAAQESGREAGERRDVNLSLLQECGHYSVAGGNGNYDEMVYCGEIEGLPAVSLTSPIPQRTDIAPPSATYIRTIAAGIADAYRMTPLPVARYLVAKPGIAGNYGVAYVARLLSDDYMPEYLGETQRKQ